MSHPSPKRATALLACVAGALLLGASPPTPQKVPAPMTPGQAIASIPRLPKAASLKLDCSAQDTIGKVVERQLRQESGGDIYATGAEPPAVDDSQSQALMELNDQAFYACQMDLQQRPAELWIQPLLEKLDAKLFDLDAAKAKADEAYCLRVKKEGCAGDPGSAKKFNAQAIAAGTAFLKDSQPGYGQYLAEIADCVSQREKIIAAARRADAHGSYAQQLAGATEVDWGMAISAATAQSQLCGKAREAAGRYLEPR